MSTGSFENWQIHAEAPSRLSLQEKNIVFSKYQAIGNDFIVFDASSWRKDCSISWQEQWILSHISFLCDRNFGIGADGVILIHHVSHEHAAFVRIYNRDGSEALHCGNGLRCVAKFLGDKKGIREDVFLHINDRKVRAQFLGDTINIEMGQVTVARAEKSQLFRHIELDASLYYAEISNCHVISLVDLKKINIENLAKSMEKNYLKNPMANFGFLSKDERGHYHHLVWERGVGLTKGCGSGACAAAAAMVLEDASLLEKPISIHQPGGILTIVLSLKHEYMETQNVHTLSAQMAGSVSAVFDGVMKAE